MLVLFWLTVGAVARMDERTAGGIDVAVTAFRWQWRFDYPDDGVTIVGLPDTPAEMVVPVGEPVHVTLTSPDVIHSFYVPAFLFKRDATPGRPTEFEFTVDGSRDLCAVSAPSSAASVTTAMTLKVVAVSRPDYDAWLADNQAGAGTAP